MSYRYSSPKVTHSLDLAYLLVTALLIFGFAFGWNNSGLTTGNLSSLMNYNLALILTIAGVFAGLFIFGREMSSSVVGKLVSTSISGNAVLAGVVASVVLLILLTILKLPVSLSNCTVGAFVGAGLASHSAVNSEFLTEVVASWVFGPFLCALVTIIAYITVVRLERNFSLPTVSFVNRILLVISVFYVAFALGGNNIGVIVSFTKSNYANGSSLLLDAAVFMTTAAGMVLFGKSIAKIVADKIVGLSQIKTLSAMFGSAVITSVFTFLSVPVSLTQVIIGGMLGAGIAHRPSIVNSRELVELIAGWTLVTLASAGLGFILASMS
ncbi:MAG: inorganic phosphate transporter [Nitrososphaerota archaeon]|nr:inorganic phosphate transporter [Nitrososphaerota archaeon]